VNDRQRSRLPVARAAARALSDPEPFLELAGHAPAEGERRRAAAQPHEVLTVGTAVDALEVAYEVLRGPQCTPFGAGSEAGTVRNITH
jgi:hypothetical protein